MLLKKDKIIIELYGIPGVGKSTLARKLVDEENFTHFTGSTVTRFDYIKLTLKHPITVTGWLRLILKNYFEIKSTKHLRYNISLLFNSLKRIHQAKKSSATYSVIDEGLVQRFLSYSNIILSEKDITRLIKISPLGNFIILVNNREVASDRYTEAYDRASEGLDKLQRWRANMVKNLTQIKTILNRNTTITHHETANASISDILQKINITPL